MVSTVYTETLLSVIQDRGMGDPISLEGELSLYQLCIAFPCTERFVSVLRKRTSKVSKFSIDG